jgi:hypothetical protein
LGERRLHLEAVPEPVDLMLQDLTGLVGPASRRCVLPPQRAAGHATPLCIVVEERREGLRIALVERVDRSVERVDHPADYDR